MNTFTGTSSYRRFRPGIPAALAAHLAQETPAGSPLRLLDVGTGPGLVAQALAPYFDEVIAVDSDQTMCAEAEAALRPALSAGQRLHVQHTLAEDFMPPAGWHPHLVTCGRVFHWLDQPRLLNRLNEYIAPDGVLAVFSDRSLWTADSAWQHTARTVVQQFLGEQRHAGDDVFGPPGQPYEDALRASAFHEVTTATIPVRREWRIDEVLGYLYSTSFAAPHLFGERQEAFEAALTDSLAPFIEGGFLVEDNAFTVLTARRPCVRGR
ncbi:class I SAM-dependent methyltransferase [Streptomyces bluensis]|uniref:Class I SAM-dependent methyltransferase n=1 Tax=Streptomyces bluensis TaxID=33897 RepID=A0ABW6UAK8_9ACTN